MSAVINMKQKNIGMDYLKRTAGYISGAVGSYISEAMPMTSDTLGEAKKTVSDVHSTFTHTAQSILPKARELRRQIGFRSISDWFNQKEDEFSSNGFDDADLGFDIPVDDVSTEAEITELAETGNQISRAVIESAHKSVEAQMEATANLTTSMSELTSVVTTGFDQTNKLLSKMLEVLTKNTSTLIEATVANNASVNPEQNMVSSGRFNLRDYKNVITGNIKNSEFGVLATMAPMLLNPDMIKGALTPQELIKSGLSFGLNKMAPNLKKNLKVLDDAVNDTIMDSLIRLGENRDFGDRGLIGRIFGLDSSRKDTDTARSKLELKAVPYDTISKESLTSAIPGYLRQILIAVGGPDMVYDYRSRSFKTKDRIRKEFQDASAGGGQLWNASDHVRSKLGTSRFDQMSYDLMINDLSGKTSHGQGRRQVDRFRNYQEAEDYVLKVLYGDQLSSEEDIASAKAFARGLSQIEPGKLHDITTQVAKSNLTRTKRMSQYAKTADQYNVDLSEFTDTVADTAQAIRDAYGRSDLGPKNDETAVIQRGKPETYASKDLSGVNYTNIALYQIFRRLNEGINVFKTGESKKLKKTPYPIWGDDILPRPKDYRPKRPGNQDASEEGNAVIKGLNRDPDEPNLLRNQTLEDGTEEDLTKGQRFSRWGKKRGGDLAHAIFSGDPDQVRAAFSGIVGDVSQVAGDGIKSGISKINDSFGNVSGYLKHKMFGTEYTYTDTDENGNEVTKVVEKNDGGGIFGFVGKKIHSMFDEAKASGSKWFQTVASYFDYGEKDESSDVKSKRKRLINTSVGAMAGAGLLGGPIGLIMGAVAGNALSATGIGEKIKGMLFGRDEKGKAKGILTRVGDSVVDPIRYQVGKSVEHVGNILKKNILGPLSDIGAAIHDRITTAASDTFGKVFGTIGNIILAPFKGIGKALISAAKLPITLAGNLFRGVTGIESGAASGVMNLTASMIAGKNSTHKIRHEDGTVEEISTREWLKQRRKDRAADVKESKKNSKYSDFKTWQAETHAKDAADRQALRDAMSETVRDYDPERDNPTAEIKEDTAEIKDAATKQAEDTAEIKDSVSEMAKEALTEGSLFTHDKGLHDRVDKIINFLTGKSSGGIKNTTEPVSDHRNESEITDTLDENRRENEEASIKGSLISGASNLIASGDKVDTEESRITNSMLSEVGKDDADKGKMVKDYQELMALQDSKKEEAEVKDKEEKSIFEKIFDTITDSDLLKNLGLLAGASALIAALLNGNIGDTLGNIKTGLDYLMGKHTGADEEGMDSVDDGVNAALAVVDANVSSKWSLANPFAKVFHTRRDGSGTKVVDQDKTDAKFNWQLGVPIAQSITTPAAYNILAHNQELKTYSLIEQSQAATDPKVAARLDKRATHAAELSDKYNEKAEDLSSHAGSSIASNVANNFARVGIMSTISKGIGGIANLGAQRLGLDEEASTRVGNIATAGTTSALLFNQAKSTLTGKTSVVDNILGLLKKAFNALADKFASVDKLKGIAGKIGKMFDDIYNKSIGKITETVATKIAQTIAARTGQEVTKELISTVTVGIGIAIGAVSGVISGVCSAEHLFQVKPGEADGLMKTISAVMKGVFGALEWTPVVGLVVAAIDVFDKFVFKSVFGKSLEQIIAEMLYNLMKGDEGATLSEKQGAMVSELNYYNETYGASMNIDTFNDFANNGGWVNKLWRGGMKTDDSGHFIVDEAGGRIDGGLKGLVVGGEKAYAHDSSGAILKDEYGNAVQAVDQYGRGIKKDAKWGDAVGNWFSDVGRWFAGGNKYQTDENGEAVRDENGALIVESTSKNVFGRAGDAISNWWNGEEITNPDGSTTKTKGFAEAATDTMKNIGSTIATPFKEVGSWFKSGANGIKNWWSGTEITNPDGSVTKTEGFADAAKRTLGNVGSAISTPVKDFAQGASQWVSDKATWLGDKAKDAGAWIKDKATTAWDTISTPVKDMVKGVGDWAKNSAEWVKDKAKDAKDWIADKAKNIFSGITDNIKGMATGIKDWVENKADWVKDGVKDVASWIGDKAKGIWDWITGPIKDLEERGEQDKKDQEYINSRGSGGPVGGPVPAADQMWDRNSQSDGEKTGETTTVKEGGNPLNKAFGISSKYGWRVLDKGNEFHSGIDMYPTDGSRQAEVGARFNGTIKSVENNVSYSGLNTPSQYSAGNYVTYVTDSGMTIKNFHLKKGSIPSNIKPGERVKVGDKLGDMGTTGRSTGPHLHYQMESPNVTDAKGKHTFDPTSSVNGGETMSSFNSYGYTTPTDVTSGSSVISGTDCTSENGGTSALSGLARLLEILKNAGTAFLNKITGGLFGNANANNNSMINTTGSDTGVSTTSSIFYAGSKVNDVEEFLNIARNEIGTKENPDGSNNVKYNTWYYGHAVSGNDYPWCMAFVQWCFDQAGLTLQYKTAGCGSLLNWYKENAPDRLIARNGDVKPGDIMIFNEHTHTGIVEKVNGDNIVTIEGNTSPNEKGSQANGGCVARKTRSRSKIMNFIRAVDFEALANSAKSLSGAGEGAEALWTFLKGMGYNDIAIAGILGCWQNESALRAKRIEGDYLANFPGYDAMMNDQSVMDRWVTEGLHKTPEKNPGYFIGNHAYPGIGFAQWTRGRTKKLVDYAKSVGKSWFDPAAQLGYFQQELSDNYYKKSRPEELNKAGSIEAATRQFCSNFEGYNGDSGIAKRQASARDLYKTYAGKISALPGSDATGGKSEILYPDANEQMTQPVGGPNNANEDGMIDFDGVDANMGKGGPVNDTTSGGSELTTTTYTRPATTPSRKNSQTSSITTGSTSSSAIVPSSQTPKPDATEYPSYTTTTGSDDLSEVVDLLQEVIAHLVAISGNTEMSNTLLDSINGKDFKDQGLRDSLGRLKDVKKNNSYARHGGQMSAGNKRAISALARP